MGFHRALAVSALNESVYGGKRHTFQIGIHPAHGVEIVVDRCCGFGIRRAIKKLQCADRSLDLIRSRDRLQGFLAHLGGGGADDQEATDGRYWQ